MVSKKKIITALVLLVVFISAICLFEGCFVRHEQKVKTPKVVIQNYNTLISDWNGAVAKLIGSDYHLEQNNYLLSRDSNTKVINKLNSIISQINTSKQFNVKYKCILDKNKSIYMPSNSYSKFLSQNAIRYEANFTKNDTEDAIISKLKRVFKSRYIDNNMLKKVAYLNSFKFYFEDKKSDFHKNGFKIKDYNLYIKMVKKFNAKCKQKDGAK